jgi:hypothetical protein
MKNEEQDPRRAITRRDRRSQGNARLADEPGHAGVHGGERGSAAWWAFGSVTCVRPPGQPPVVIRDAAVAADYVASLASHYQDEISRPWPDVVEDVRQEVQAVINDDGAFITSGDLAASMCR